MSASLGGKFLVMLPPGADMKSIYVRYRFTSLNLKADLDIIISPHSA